MAAAPEVAVAFIIREKFSLALASLRRLYTFADAPFRIYFVDGRYPPALRHELDAFLGPKDNVVRLDAPRYLYPSEALNLALEHAAEPFTLVLQNDILIGRGTLERLLDTARTKDADAVVPVVLDLDKGAPRRHHDEDCDVAFEDRDGKIHVGRTGAADHTGARRIDFFEMHCLLARTATLRGLAPLPPLNVHEHVDLCLSLWRAGRAAYLQEEARVLFAGSPPLPLRDFELPYYRFRWDPARARQSDRYVRDRWPIAELFEPSGFVAYQLQATRPEAVLSGYAAFAEDAWPEDFSAA